MDALPVETAMTVLFVDDERPILKGLERALRSTGYRVLLANGAAEALAILAAHAVDVLVADVDMPEMNGLELVEIARRDHPEMTRMLLTAQSSFDLVVKAINDGAIAKYLTKPWNADLLLDTLSDARARLQVARAGGDGEAHVQRAAAYEKAYPGISEVARGAGGVVEVSPDRVVIAALDCPASLRGLVW